MHGQHTESPSTDAEGGGMGHGAGWRGALMMLLCCLPMIAIVALLAFGLLR